MQITITNFLFNYLLTLILPVMPSTNYKTTIEGLNDSFASTLLTLLILSALVLTFYSKGATVHKVVNYIYLYMIKTLFRVYHFITWFFIGFLKSLYHGLIYSILLSMLWYLNDFNTFGTLLFNSLNNFNTNYNGAEFNELVCLSRLGFYNFNWLSYFISACLIITEINLHIITTTLQFINTSSYHDSSILLNSVNSWSVTEIYFMSPIISLNTWFKCHLHIVQGVRLLLYALIHLLQISVIETGKEHYNLNFYIQLFKSKEYSLRFFICGCLLFAAIIFISAEYVLVLLSSLIELGIFLRFQAYFLENIIKFKWAEIKILFGLYPDTLPTNLDGEHLFQNENNKQSPLTPESLLQYRMDRPTNKSKPPLAAIPRIGPAVSPAVAEGQIIVAPTVKPLINPIARAPLQWRAPIESYYFVFSRDTEDIAKLVSLTRTHNPAATQALPGAIFFAGVTGATGKKLIMQNIAPLAFVWSLKIRELHFGTYNVIRSSSSSYYSAPTPYVGLIPFAHPSTYAPIGGWQPKIGVVLGTAQGKSGLEFMFNKEAGSIALECYRICGNCGQKYTLPWKPVMASSIGQHWGPPHC